MRFFVVWCGGGRQAYNGDDYQGARIVTKALALKDAVWNLNLNLNPNLDLHSSLDLNLNRDMNLNLYLKLKEVFISERDLNRTGN